MSQHWHSLERCRAGPTCRPSHPRCQQTVRRNKRKRITSRNLRDNRLIEEWHEMKSASSKTYRSLFEMSSVPVKSIKAAPLQSPKAAPLHSAKAAPLQSAKAAPLQSAKGAPFQSAKALKDTANRERGKQQLLSSRTEDCQPPKEISRPETFPLWDDQETVPKTYYGGEENDDENAKDIGSEKDAALEEGAPLEKAMSDMLNSNCQTNTLPDSLDENLVTVVERRNPEESRDNKALMKLMREFVATFLRLREKEKEQHAEDLAAPPEKGMEELKEKETTKSDPDCPVNCNEDSGVGTSLSSPATLAAEDLGIDAPAMCQEEEDTALKAKPGLVCEGTGQDGAGEGGELEGRDTPLAPGPGAAGKAAGEEDGFAEAERTVEDLLKTCMGLKDRLLECSSEGPKLSSGSQAGASAPATVQHPPLPLPSPRQQRKHGMLAGGWQGRTAADSGRGASQSGHSGGAPGYQGPGSGGAGGGGSDWGGGGGGGRGWGGGAGRRGDDGDDPGRREGQQPSRDVADLSTVPTPNHKRNCEGAPAVTHAHLSETGLFEILGAVGTPHWQSLDKGWLKELHRCLTLVMHDVVASQADVGTCSVCAVLHSLLSHFTNRRCQQPCDLCVRTFFMLQCHVDACLLGGKPERVSQADICYQVSLSVNFDPNLLRCLWERVWGKIHKYLSKVLSISCTEDEEAMEEQPQQAEQPTAGGRPPRARRYTPSLSSIAEVQQQAASFSSSPATSAGDALAPAPARDYGGARPKYSSPHEPPPPLPPREERTLLGAAPPGAGDVGGLLASIGSAEDPEGSASTSGTWSKRKLGLTIPAMAKDYAGVAVASSTSFAEVEPSLGDASRSGSLSSQTSQGSQSADINELIYMQYKPQIEQKGRIEVASVKKSRPAVASRDQPKTYGSSGYQSLPEWQGLKRVWPNAEQLMSLVTQPVGKPGIGEVVYGTKHLLSFVARYWGSKSEHLQYQVRYQLHLREEGVILDPYKEQLKILMTRYQKNVQWRRLVHLGNGVSGKCHLAMDLSTKHKFCVKRIHLSIFEESELDIWSELDHENIVKVFGALRHGQKIYIFAEFIDGGNLSACISKQRELNRRLSHWSALCIFRQILEALVYLKSKGCIHEDLKADNILIRSGGPVPAGPGVGLGSIQIAIADFGMAQRVTNERGRSKQSPVGAPTQWSPEKASSEGHSYAADVWAATCVLVHMLSGTPPWIRRFSNAATLHYIIFTRSPPMEDVPENIKEEVRDLIVQGFTVDPTRRPSARQLLQHRSFQLLRNNSANLDVYYSNLLSHGSGSVNNRLAEQDSDQGLQQILHGLKIDQPSQERASSTGEQEIPGLTSRKSSGGPAPYHTVTTVRVVEVPGPCSQASVAGTKRSPETSSSREEKAEAEGFIAYAPPLLPLELTLTLPGVQAAAPGASQASPIVQSSYALISSPPSSGRAPAPAPPPGQDGSPPQPGRARFVSHHQIPRSSSATTYPPSRPAPVSASCSAPDLGQAGGAPPAESPSSLALTSTPTKGSPPGSGSKGSSPRSGGEGEEAEAALLLFVQDVERGGYTERFPPSPVQRLPVYTGLSSSSPSSSSSSTLTPSANIPTFLQLTASGLSGEEHARPGPAAPPRTAQPGDRASLHLAGPVPEAGVDHAKDHFDSSELFSHAPPPSMSMPVLPQVEAGEAAPSPPGEAPRSSRRTSLQVVIPRPRTNSDVQQRPSPPRQRFPSHSSPGSASPHMASRSSSPRTSSPRTSSPRTVNKSPFEEQEECFRAMNSMVEQAEESDHLLEESTTDTGSIGVSSDVSTLHISMLEHSHVEEKLDYLQRQISIQEAASDSALDSLTFELPGGQHLCKVRVPRRNRDWRTLWELVSPKVAEAGLAHVMLQDMRGRAVDPLQPPPEEENMWVVAPVEESSDKCWCEAHFVMR